MKTHNCETELRERKGHAFSTTQTGEKFHCSCGRIYEFWDDEAEGGSWVLVYDPTVRPAHVPPRRPE